MHKNIYNNNKKAYAASFQIRSSIKKFKGDLVTKGISSIPQIYINLFELYQFSNKINNIESVANLILEEEFLSH